MNNEGLKWLLIGLAGVAMIAVVLGLVVLTVSLLGFGFYQAGLDANLESGMEQRAKAERKYLDQLNEYGLLDRYTIYSSEGKWRDILYEQEDFEAIEDQLEKQFTSDDERESNYSYSGLCNGLGSIPYGTDPDHMRAVLDRWLEARPQSHRARIVLGRFLVNYAWAWRGSGYANTVSDEGVTNFRHALLEARTVLEEAREARPDDAEPPNMLLSVALGLGLSRETMEEYYADAIDAVPHHFGARSAKYQFILPKWHGSWEEADAFLQECLKDADRYPYLRTLQYSAYREMNNTRKGYTDLLEEAEIQFEVMSIYEELLESRPDSLWIQCDYAYALYYFEEYEKSIAVFEQIGDRFHTSSLWTSVISYNRSRSGAYAAYSGEVEDVDERESYMNRAIEIAPYEGYPFFKRGRFFAQAGRMEEAEADALAAIGVDKNYLKAHQLLHYIYAHQGRFDEIIAISDSMLAEDLSDEVREVLESAKRRAESSIPSAGNQSAK